MTTDIVPILKEYYPFWERLSADGQNTFAACSAIRSYDKGSFIRSDCDECLGVLLVLSGELRIYIQSDEGREVTLFRPGRARCARSPPPVSWRRSPLTSSWKPRSPARCLSPVPAASTGSWSPTSTWKTSSTSRPRSALRRDVGHQPDSVLQL